MDLPEHPHLVTCLFFRTIEDRLAIFSEYVDSGSIQEKVAQKKIYELKAIIDVAIQVAWGLQAAHDHGVVHQDVKPSNILVAKDGIVKITDFGLSRIGIIDSPGFEPAGDADKTMVSNLGMTPAYCSPEQARGHKVDYRTDIWSLGVSILEMFAGGIKWANGLLAPVVMEAILLNERIEPFPQLPEGLAEILRKCFKEEPDERWRSMAQFSDALREFHMKFTGQPYQRIQPESHIYIPQVSSSKQDQTDFRNWEDPRIWLDRYLGITGRELKDMDYTVPEPKGSFRSQAIIDLEIYEELERLYSKLEESVEYPLSLDLATIQIRKATIHEYLNDMPGAIQIYDKAVGILKSLPQNTAPLMQLSRLMECAIQKGKLQRQLGNRREAIDTMEKALTLTKTYPLKSDPDIVKGNLSAFYSYLAVNHAELGEFNRAIERFDAGIAIMSELVEIGDSGIHREQLARQFINKAIILKNMGQIENAGKLYDQAAELLEETVWKTGTQEQIRNLAILYINKALVEWTAGTDTQESLRCACNEPVLFKKNSQVIITNTIYLGFFRSSTKSFSGTGQL